MNQFMDGGDCGDEYNYCPPARDQVVAPGLKGVSITRGPVQQTLILHMELITAKSLDGSARTRAREGVSMPITSVVTLTSGSSRVDIRTTVDNRARDHRLRVHFPAPFTSESAEHDGHFEIVDRAIGLPAFDASWVEEPRPEVPQRVFTSVTNGTERLTIANRGLPEVEVLKNAAGNAEIALTLLRCVGWLSRDDFSNRKGHAGPFIETPGAQVPGEWTFDYSIILDPDSLPAYQHAYAFEAPFKAFATDIHAGTVNAGGSFLQVTPQEFLVSAVKRSEDGRGWIVRGYNVSGKEIQVALQPWRTFRRVAQTNLAEELIKPLKADKEGRIALPLRGHEIVTVKFRD